MILVRFGDTDFSFGHELLPGIIGQLLFLFCGILGNIQVPVTVIVIIIISVQML